MAKFSGGENYPIYFGAKPEIFKLAGALRHNMTSQEKILWAQLRNRKLLGFKFRPQHPFKDIILDFFCFKERLAIEVDGDIHNDSYQQERDAERTAFLKKFGIEELRFTNWEVENQIEKVLDKLKNYLKMVQPPSPRRVKGQGIGAFRSHTVPQS
jgi:very-short-patch-repair endonuclease